MRTIEKALFLSAYLLLPLIPVSLFLQGASSRLTFLALVSRVAGIYVVVWLLLQFLLTSRARLLEKLVGQDRLIVFHLLAAIAAFTLIAVHTALGGEERGLGVLRWFGGAGLAVLAYVSVFSALFLSDYYMRFFPFFIPLRDWISQTFRLSYERCLWVHNTMAAGMLLVLVHVLLLPDPGLGAFKISMTAFTTAGLGVFSWRKVLAPALWPREPWKVAEVVRESDTVTTLSFEHPRGKRLRHHPGQFCYLLPVEGELPKQSHPFTLSSGPRDPRPTVTVKRLGDFTSRLMALEPGSSVQLEGPYGRFSCRHVPADRDLVLIAGGIGITPMLSMMRHLFQEDPERRVTLIWGARDTADLIRLKEIEDLSRGMKHFAFEPVLSGDRGWKGRTGRIGRALIEDVIREGGRRGVRDLGTSEFFVCGPPPMIRTVIKALTEMGVASRHIHTERFAF